MHVTKLKLEHIKAFDSVELDFSTESGESYAGFHVIAGGNASGKTTLLRAIALCLSGPEYANQFGVKPLNWVGKRNSNWHSSKHKPTYFESNCEITLVKNTEDLLRFNTLNQLINTDKTFPSAISIFTNNDFSESDFFYFQSLAESGKVNSFFSIEEIDNLFVEKFLRKQVAAHLIPRSTIHSGWFAAGYGPFRRLTGNSSDAINDSKSGGRVTDFLTLFREDAALTECDDWLRDLKFKSLEEGTKTNQSADLLNSIINFLNDEFFPSGFFIKEVTSNGVMVEDTNGTMLLMRDMSDGCRSAYALVLDIIFRMIQAYKTNDLFEPFPDNPKRVRVKMPGVVLIDEMESHLHPSWQRLLPQWLMEKFPQIQFIVTTHSPLIVQAATTGTIHALPMPDEKDRQPRKLRGEDRRRVLMGDSQKVLLGSAFELDNTRSEWALERMEKYRMLLSKKSAKVRLTATEKTEFTRLEKDMKLAFEDEPGKLD